MLPPFIIEQIRKREEEERKRYEQPQLELPLSLPPTRASRSAARSGEERPARRHHRRALKPGARPLRRVAFRRTRRATRLRAPRSGRLYLRFVACHAALVAAVGLAAAQRDAACYDTGDGTAPPLNDFYFPGRPPGLARRDGPLRRQLGLRPPVQRRHAPVVRPPADPPARRSTSSRTRANPNVPLLRRRHSPGTCPGQSAASSRTASRARQPLGETCAPPVDSRVYVRDSAIIGAFATDLCSRSPVELVPRASSPRPVPTDADRSRPAADHAGRLSRPLGAPSFDRLFVPVRGNATLTWADVERDTSDARRPTDHEARTLRAVPISTAARTRSEPLRRCASGGRGSERGRQHAPHHDARASRSAWRSARTASRSSSRTRTRRRRASSRRASRATRTTTDRDRAAVDPVHPRRRARSAASAIATVPHDRDAFLGAPDAPARRRSSRRAAPSPR